MPMTLLIAASVAAAVPTAPASAPKEATVSAAAEGKAKPAKDPMAEMAMMLAMFDKFFPAGPEPDPARLTSARDLTMTMFPKGAYSQAMTGFLNRTADRVLDMSEADFAAMFPEEPAKKGKKAAKPKVPSTEPLRVQLARKDPNFDATVAAVKAFAGTMLTKVGDVAEPKFREGMARSLARKFDERQLAEIRTFLATPTGAAYGREVVGLWFDPEVIRGTFQALPEMMALMPDLMKDGSAFETQMKALGKPAGKN